MEQAAFVVDCRPVRASEFFMQGFEDFEVCEQLPVDDAPAPALHRWRVVVPGDRAEALVQHAQAAAHVVAVQEVASAA